MVRVMRGVVLALVTSGCGTGLPFSIPGLGNNLEGSVSAAADLEFDEVEVRKFSTSGELQVRYLRNKNGNNEVVCQVTVTPPSGGVAYGAEIDLKANNGSVSRVVQDADDFPPLKQGKIRYDSGAANEGDQTRGRFNATFENDKTLNGAFDAKLKVL